MDVSCPHCQTLYEFDDRQVSARKGVTLQCSQCDHLFRLKTDSGPQDERQRRWMVRASDSGDILYFATFQTLHEWIMEGRVGEDDEISRTGTSWKALREIGEFAPIFQVVASIADLTGGANDEEKPEGNSASVTGEETGAVDDSLSPSARRRRRSTDRQFEVDASPETTPVPDRDVEHTGSPDTPSPQTTPERRPSATPHRQRRDSSSPSPQPDRAVRSTPAPRLKDERLRARSTPSKPEESQDDDWTLGQLEHSEEEPGVVDEMDVDMSSVRRRRWPAVVLVVVIVGIAAGIWQREALEDALGSAQVSSSSEAEEQEEIDSSSEAMARAQEAIQSGLHEADAARRSVETAKVVPVVQGQIAEAMEAATAEAGEAGQPTVEELLASGRRSLDSGNQNQARQYFQAALDQSPNHPQALLGLAQSRLGSAQFDRAISKFEAVRSIDADIGEALIGIGTARRALGQNDRALEAYEEYLEQFPDGPQASIAEFQAQDLRD